MIRLNAALWAVSAAVAQEEGRNCMDDRFKAADQNRDGKLSR